MSNNKQSSVDFIHDSLIKYIGFEDIESTKIFDKIFEQAKAMHKDEICKSYVYGSAYGIDVSNGLKPDKYYNETFGGDK